MQAVELAGRLIELKSGRSIERLGYLRSAAAVLMSGRHPSGQVGQQADGMEVAALPLGPALGECLQSGHLYRRSLWANGSVDFLGTVTASSSADGLETSVCCPCAPGCEPI